MFSIMKADTQTLSTEALREAFGAIRLELAIHPTKGLRVSCVHRVEDNLPLACSIVHFDPVGVARLGVYHQLILEGAPLGQTVATSGLRFERVVSDPQNIPTSYATRFLFGVAATHLPSRIVEYTVDGLPYCRIREMYNPSVITADNPPSNDVADETPFVVALLRHEYSEAYLRLAHGFLRKNIHVGIADEDTFVYATTATLVDVLHDANSVLIVAADAQAFIGYIAMNIHPALHLNGRECMVRELYVSEHMRRRGVATALLTYAERIAKSRGAPRVALATNWHDEAQRGFYESLGYAYRCDFATKPL